MLFLAVSVCFVSFAADASGGCGSGLTWTYSEASKTLTISGNGAMNDYAVTTTSALVAKKDRPTDAPWYSHYADVTRIYIKNGVTKIGDNAFRRFNKLTQIELPGSVETIGSSAFRFCSSLVSASFNYGLKSIGGAAFEYCSALKTFNIPDSVESIADYAFYKCPVKDLVLGRNVTTIGSYAFSECKLVNVTMYNKVEVIGQSAFAKQNGNTKNVISHVYYCGTQAQWNSINIGNDNAPLTGAALHFNSTAPTTQPATQPTTQPTTQSTILPTILVPQGDNGTQQSFFERILQMILDFFARLFGR